MPSDAAPEAAAGNAALGSLLDMIRSEASGEGSP